MKPAPGVVGRCRCILSLQKIGSGSAILAYKPARLLPPFRIFDFVLDTSPRQNANKFAFALGLIVSLQKIEGDSTIFAGLFARLRSSLEDKIRFGQVQTTDARNIHRRHLQTLPCKEEEKEENRKLSLTCRSPFTIFVEDRIRL